MYYAPFDEDLGFVTIEAFKARKPVLTARDSGAVLEFVVDGRTGVVHDPDSSHFARSFDRFWSDPDSASTLGAAGEESVVSIEWNRVIASLTSTLVSSEAT